MSDSLSEAEAEAVVSELETIGLAVVEMAEAKPTLATVAAGIAEHAAASAGWLRDYSEPDRQTRLATRRLVGAEAAALERIGAALDVAAPVAESLARRTRRNAEAHAVLSHGTDLTLHGDWRLIGFRLRRARG